MGLRHSVPKPTQLHRAVRRGQLERVKELLINQPELVDATYGEEGLTPLHWAAIYGWTDIVKEILEAKPDAKDQVTNAGENILHLMAKHGRNEAYQSTFMRYALYELAQQTDEYGNTVLHLSVEGKSTELFTFIHGERSAGVNDLNNERKTALDVAIDTDSQEMIGIIRAAHGVTGKESELWKRRKATDEQLIGLLNSSGLAASLIATLAFTTLLNPPGGVYQDGDHRGKAILSTHPLFHTFLIFNVIALLTSLFDVVMQFSSVAFTSYHLHRRRAISRTLMALSSICISTDYAMAAWMIYHSGRAKTPIMISVSVLVGLFILATFIAYLSGRLNFWKATKREKRRH